MAKAKNKAVFILEPAGLMDRGDPRVTEHAGKAVQKTQPFGCPPNGTMGMVFVQVASTGEFIGLVSKNSLKRTGRSAPFRDLAAEARDSRSRRAVRA